MKDENETKFIFKQNEIKKKKGKKKEKKTFIRL